MKKFLNVLVFVPALMVTSHAHAQWTGQAGLGVVASSGNTDNRAVTGTLGIAKQSGLWKHNIFADAYKAKTDGVESADRFMLGYKADRNFTDRLYGWGSLRYETDSFADIDRRIVAGVGVGYKVLLGPVHFLDLEGGIGYQTTNLIAATPNKINGAIVLAAANYEAKLSDTLSFTQRLAIEAGSDNKLITSTTGLNVKVSDVLSLNLGYSIRRNSDIVGARGKKSDNVTTINLVYAIK
jgi:putative salt-induced outer membrane protein